MYFINIFQLIESSALLGLMLIGTDFGFPLGVSYREFTVDK